uniref:Uncharacterized protein n=1 Tax=Anopheles maculatus TaxID=74869 RepID=A0A182SYD1_9DIPT
MQWDGVFKFFQNLCPNVPSGVLRTRLTGAGFERMLQLVLEILAKGVQFKVDDNFTTISLFGYSFEFDALFSINWSELRTLLLFLQSSMASISSTAGPKRWTQLHADDVVKLLQIVSQLRDVSCTLLADYITLGRGHRFTLGTVRALFTAPTKLNKLKLLRQLASLDKATTEALNALRESGRISGGDPELLKWLANHNVSNYLTALTALLSVHTHSSTADRPCSTPIAFEHDRIVVSPLLAFSAADFLKVPKAWRDILLYDDRFLRLAADADRDLLLPRATTVWLRTCCSDTNAIRYRETMGLLRELFEHHASTSTPTMLAFALDYALGFENMVTVSQVYYSILSAWKQLTAVTPAAAAPLNIRTMQARFLQLMADADSFGMSRYHRSPTRDELDLHADDSIVRLAREEIQNLADVPADQDCTIPFGPIERAACWLGMIPALRNPAGRRRILRRVATLVKSGSGRVLQSTDENHQYRQTIDIRRLMFVNHGDKVIVEVKIPGDGYVYVSLHLCGQTICATGAT